MGLQRLRRSCMRLCLLASRAPGNRLPNTSRTITSLASYAGEPPERPKPFNYRTTQYNRASTAYQLPYSITKLDEYTAWRLDGNSKVIAVEGNVASGKHEFAKELAKQLGFFYAPQCPVEKLWYNEYYDFYEYEIDEALEPALRLYTPSSWHADSRSKPAENDGYQGRVGGLQMDYLRIRMHAYCDALLHMLSTGQGIVIVRTPWTDYAFAKALLVNGYFTKQGWEFYEYCYRNIVNDNPRPHVTIYIDNPVSTIMDNIKKRNRPGESTSGKIDRQFLKTVEETYHDHVMPILKEQSDVLMYNYMPNVRPHDISLVVEDIEDLGSLEPSLVYGEEYQNDWLELDIEARAADLRTNMQNTTYRGRLLEGMQEPHKALGMVMSIEDDIQRKRLLRNIPGYRYEDGFDKDLDGFANSLTGPTDLKDIRKFYIPRSELLDQEEVVPTLLSRYF